ncbi:hypothetical protein L291_2104 [Acinetobacter guillouiae MSP4-18]|uniref:hypothetical protein n=1 Tax=Acinetobacter guillouiae TaxID=106649 RepID=UPI0002CDF900|nr:hypothetical protein [Acinetobacter guillouiae]ENU56897.1 hypothetical protein F981_04032 [Acinetobacter guillouiae CIP 63.46]EPH35281.1 hypothetical protein L291_2104 [Acinetobacter guillouiae MSP4-18]KAB0623954.1 hypothetical protein F7P82_19155 [Acinetobacter guillouiae]
MNILNSNEAFSALMAGKNIMCRAVGELMDFDDLNQFPATIFALPGYEFCIKRESLTLADIQFTKPVEPHDLENGQEIFIVMPTCILRTKYDPEHGDICLSVANGFAQLDAENAQLQLQAFGKTFGNMITEIEIKDGFSEKPKKSKAPRKTKEAFKSEDTPEIETDPALIIDKFAAKIANCSTTEAVLLLRPVFFANGHLEREHTQHLCKLTENKLIEIDPEQYAPKPSYIDHQIYIDGINACVSEEEIKTTLHDVNDQGFSEEQLSEINLAKCSKLAEFQATALKNIQDNQYDNLLKELLERAKKSKLPAEANALYKYTVNWTEEQRKPLMDAINKRLSELGATAPPPEQPPSLVVQIQNAPDLTALDILEIDVATRHPDIQPKLMGLVRKRRFELENSGSNVMT